MDPERLRALLGEVREGTTSIGEALGQLRDLPFADLGYAMVDHHRALRQGVPEVIFGEGKTADQVIAIAAEAGKAGAPVLITRLQPEKSAEVAARFPGARVNAAARTITLHAPAPAAPRPGEPHVVVAAAGTSDLPVAEEAAEVLVEPAAGDPELYLDVPSLVTATVATAPGVLT